MTKKRIYWIVSCMSFCLMMFFILVSTIYQASISTSGAQSETEKKISQNVQQELSNMVFENQQLSAALSKEQEKVGELEAQLSEYIKNNEMAEKFLNIQTALLEAHMLFDYGRYKESRQKLSEISSEPLSEGALQVYNSVAKALSKKGYSVRLR